MKKLSAPKTAMYTDNTTASSSMFKADWDQDRLATKLLLAKAKIKNLKEYQVHLEEALAKSREERESLATELYALKSGCHSSEMLTHLKSELEKRDLALRRVKEAEETDRLVLLDALRKVLKKGKSPMLPSIDDLPKIPIVKAVVTVLRYTESLLTETSQMERVTLLGGEIQATLERSNQLLNTPKRKVVVRTFSQEKLSLGSPKPVLRKNTRISICRPRGDSTVSEDVDEGSPAFVNL